MSCPPPDGRPLRFGIKRSEPEGRDDRCPQLERDYRSATAAELVTMVDPGATLLFDLSYLCDLRCRFCDLPVTERRAVDWPRVRGVIGLLATAGMRRAVLTGGEPGLQPHLFEILGDLHGWGVATCLLTHGMWASDEARLRRALAAGLAKVEMSLKAFDDPAAEALVGRRSVWSRQLAGLHALSAAQAAGRLSALHLNVVITAATLDALAALPELLAMLPAAPVVDLSLIEPYRVDMLDLVPEPEVWCELVLPVLDRLAADGVAFTVEGVPLCLLGAHRERSRDLARVDDHGLRLFLSPQADADYLVAYRGYQRHLQFARTAACEGCPDARRCTGPHKKTPGMLRREGAVPR